MITYENSKCIIYQNDGAIINLSSEAAGGTDSIHLPKTNAYENEIRYFTDCVLSDQFPEKIKAEELRTVINILNNL